MPQSPSPSLLEQVRQALHRAYSLGQTYWQQADSESYKQNAKAYQTQAKFDALVAETCAALQQQEAGSGCTVTPAERDAVKEIVAGLAFICQIEDTGQLVDAAFNELERLRASAPSPMPQSGDGNDGVKGPDNG